MSKDMKKINLDELDDVSGGVIVEKSTLNRSGQYAIVDDKTGETRFTVNSKNIAERLAVVPYNTSTEVITPEEYAKQFGKPFEE